MATPNYSYEKRQRELAKKRKKEEKLKRKAEGKTDGNAGGEHDPAQTENGSGESAGTAGSGDGAGN